MELGLRVSNIKCINMVLNIQDITYMYMYVNPPTDRPFKTIQNFHFQKRPLVLYTHGDTIWTVL